MYSNILLVFIITGITVIAITVAQRAPQSIVLPRILADSWGSPSHSGNLDLVHRDEHLAVYVDSEMNRSVTWPFSLLSEAWRYVKETYGEFGPDPHLYFVLHGNKHAGCREGAFITEYFRPRNLIDCGSNSTHAWGTNYSAHYFEEMLKSLGGIIRSGAKGRYNDKDLEIARGKSNDIVVYDLYCHLRGDHDPDLARWEGRMLNEAETDIYYFRDWFLPLYKRFGGSSIMNKYYTIEGGPWKRSYMNWGEYIHCWCEAMGSDVVSWAMEAFKQKTDSKTDFQDDLAEARKKHPFNYSVSIPTRNLPAKNPPGKWEKQQLNGRNRNIINLTLVYKDEHVAMYSPTFELYPLASLKSISKTWQYTKEKYGPFGSDSDSDQLLYISIQNGTVDSCTSSNDDSFIDRVFNQTQAIDCFTTTTRTVVGSTGISASHFGPLLEERITVQMAKMSLKLSKRTGNWPGRNVSQWTMTSILAYDIYLGLGKNASAEDWRAQKLIETENFPRKDTFWFQDWYLEIYENNGNDSTILQNFFSLLNTYWPKNPIDGRNYAQQLNMGEFVHFWSGATGSSLKATAIKVLNVNSDTFAVELNKARERYPNITKLYVGVSTKNLSSRDPPAKWHKKWNGKEVDLSRAFSDGHVAYYTNGFKLDTLMPSLASISAIWNYTKTKYGPFGPTEQLLFVALQNGRTNWCTSSNNGSFLDRNSGDRHVIDCSTNRGSNGGSNNNSLYPSLEQAITLQIASMPLKLSKSTGNWPGRDVSHWTMTSILAYDIYLGVGKNDSADDWRAQKLNETENFPDIDTFWFRDWYLEIYENDNRNFTHLQNFFSLLNTYWPTVRNASHGRNYAKQLNMGEFVHFWSGATGLNLRANATNSLHLNESMFEDELVQARLAYPRVTELYTVEKAVETFPDVFYIPLPIIPSPGSPNQSIPQIPTKLTNVYKNESVGIYYDVDLIPKQVEWPSRVFTNLWKYTKATYNGILDKIDPNLHVTFYKTGKEGCKHRDAPLEITTNKGGQKSFSNVIDCGVSTESGGSSWEEEDKRNLDPILVAISDVIKAEMNFQKNQDLASKTLEQVWRLVVFDLYMREGRLEDAFKWLKDSKKGDEKIVSIYPYYWFLDWCLPIYNNYGGAKSLSQFITILSREIGISHENSKTAESGGIRKDIKLGEFLHFWSGAAGDCLKTMAKKVLPWRHETDEELMEAREKFPNVTYECRDSVDEEDKIKTTEAQKELLYYVIIIGGISLFAIVLISTAFGIKLYKAKLRERDLRDKIRNLTNEEVEEFIRGDNNYVESGNGNSNTPIHLMPFNTDFEVPKERLLVDQTKKLGEGAFGMVFEGKLLSKLGNRDEDVQVAVKTVKPNVEVPFFKAMLMEIKIMAYLGKHDNIASLLATVTANIRNREVYVALEFCSKGDILGYLRKNRINFKDLWNQTPTSPDACLFTKGTQEEKEPLVKLTSSSYTVLRTESDTTPKISTLDLLELARQVASGMAYLSSKHVIHGDLAARNVLLTADNVAKVSDFGLSRQLENYKNYTKKSTTPLPWRWMAIESLQEMIFSSETDIWAFGVTLWEIFTLGKLPFPGRNWDHEFVDFLIAGNRLQSPDFGNTEIYNLMMKCCRLMPDERLPFSDISTQLGSIKASLASVAHLHGGAYRVSSI